MPLTTLPWRQERRPERVSRVVLERGLHWAQPRQVVGIDIAAVAQRQLVGGALDHEPELLGQADRPDIVGVDPSASPQAAPSSVLPTPCPW